LERAKPTRGTRSPLEEVFLFCLTIEDVSQDLACLQDYDHDQNPKYDAHPQSQQQHQQPS